MSRLFPLLVFFALCLTAVSAGRRHAPSQKKFNHTDGSTFYDDPHPLITASNIDAKWEKIRQQLQARNYSMPVGANGGVTGVDISAWAGEDTFTCFVQNGLTFAIVRAFQSDCNVDPNGVHTVANAWAAGVSHVDIYLFPSFGCGSTASQQVDATIQSMGSIPFGTLWLDIEAQGSGWSGDTGANNDWLGEALQEASNQLGASRVGIYSSAYGWSVAMGDWTGGSGYSLWYAHYDNDPGFDDFSPFAGWSSPSMKQYQGDASVCSFDVDMDWYPS